MNKLKRLLNTSLLSNRHKQYMLKNQEGGGEEIDNPIEKGSGENSVQQKGTGADASGEGAIAFGTSVASGKEAVAFGESEASKNYSFAEGYKTKANGESSHSEGITSKATGTGAHAEGNNTTAYGNYSHSEGDFTRASGTCSHTEGTGSVAGGSDAHAEGRYSNAQGTYSHAEGVYTQAVNQAEHAQGKYNKSNSGNTAAFKTQHSVGIGTSNADRKNAFEIMQNGDAYFYGVGDYDGTNSGNVNIQTLQKIIEFLQPIIVQGTIDGNEFTPNSSVTSSTLFYEFNKGKEILITYENNNRTYHARIISSSMDENGNGILIARNTNSEDIKIYIYEN